MGPGKENVSTGNRAGKRRSGLHGVWKRARRRSSLKGGAAPDGDKGAEGAPVETENKGSGQGRLSIGTAMNHIDALEQDNQLLKRQLSQLTLDLALSETKKVLAQERLDVQDAQPVHYPLEMIDDDFTQDPQPVQYPLQMIDTDSTSDENKLFARSPFLHDLFSVSPKAGRLMERSLSLAEELEALNRPTDLVKEDYSREEQVDGPNLKESGTTALEQRSPGRFFDTASEGNNERRLSFHDAQSPPDSGFSLQASGTCENRLESEKDQGRYWACLYADLINSESFLKVGSGKSVLDRLSDECRRDVVIRFCEILEEIRSQY